MVLSGRLALVTGGGSGIGRAVCQVLARDNAKVVVADLSMDNCSETEQSLRSDDHLSVAADVSKSESVNNCFKLILDKYKRAPDIIVNSAGITRDGFMLRMKEEDFEKVVDVNLKGTFLVSQAAANLMKEQQLVCDFMTCDVKIPVETQVVHISRGKSIIPEQDVLLPLRTADRVQSVIQPAALAAMRLFIALVTRLPKSLKIPDEVTHKFSTDFASLREQQSDVAPDLCHTWMTLATSLTAIDFAATAGQTF